MEVRKGAWAKEEDILLRKCIEQYGEGRWHLVPLRAGLNRCRKSCRLRWLNYLRPNIKRGYFTKDEVDIVVRLHKLLGNRWSLIAGRIPGRTANDVKNFWNTHIDKKSPAGEIRRQRKTVKYITDSNIIRPRPRTLSRPPYSPNQLPTQPNQANGDNNPKNDTINDNPSSTAHYHENLEDNKALPTEPVISEKDECVRWWCDLLEATENGNGHPFSLPGGDHHQAVEPGLLTPGWGDHGNNNYSVDDGLSSNLAFDVDVWQLVSDL